MILFVSSMFVQVGDVRLFVRELGQRQPDQASVLVLHGGPDVGHSYLLPGLEPLSRDPPHRGIRLSGLRTKQPPPTR